MSAEADREAAELQTSLERLLRVGLEHGVQELEALRGAAAQFGRTAQRNASAQCRLLAAPLDACHEDLSDAGSPSGALAALESRMSSLLPPSAGARSGGVLSRLLQRVLSWLGLYDPQQSYFRRLAGSRGDLDHDIVALEQGRDRLRRDNITLQGDLEALNSTVSVLAVQHELVTGWMRRVEAFVTRDPRHSNEPLKAHADELQQLITERALAIGEQLAVVQQAVLSLQLIVQNNERLMSAMERALNVSVSALIVADRAAQAVSGRSLGMNDMSAIGRHAGASGPTGEDAPKALESAFAGALDALDSAHQLRRTSAQQVEGVRRSLASAG